MSTGTQSHASIGAEPHVPPLRKIRQDRGLGLRTVAAMAGIDAAHLSRIERGLADPSAPVLYRIARALGLPLAKLLRPYVGEEER